MPNTAYSWRNSWRQVVPLPTGFAVVVVSYDGRHWRVRRREPTLGGWLDA